MDADLLQCPPSVIDIQDRRKSFQHKLRRHAPIRPSFGIEDPVPPVYRMHSWMWYPKWRIPESAVRNFRECFTVWVCMCLQKMAPILAQCLLSWPLPKRRLSLRTRHSFVAFSCVLQPTMRIVPPTNEPVKDPHSRSLKQTRTGELRQSCVCKIIRGLQRTHQ